MPASRRLLPLFLLPAVLAFLVSDASLLGQTPKDKKGGPLTPDPYDITPGDPLSNRALVTKPPAVKGAKSWTIDTKRHRWQVINVSISPDGALAATSGYDGMIRIWDMATGKFIRVLVGHGYYSYGVAWSPDGSMLATTGGSDGTARVWNPRNGMTLRVLKGHKGTTGALAWSPNGRWLVVTGGSSGFATFWDVAKNKQMKTVEHGTGVYSVAWSPDGKMVACGVGAGAFLWDALSYANIRTMKQDSNTVYSVAFSADSKFLLTGGISNCNIWDTAEGNKLHTITGVTNICSCSPDGKYIATVVTGGPVQLFDAKNFAPFKTLPVNAGSISWTPEGKTLVGVYNDKLIGFDMVQFKIKQSITVAVSSALSWTPGKPIIKGIGEDKLTLWDPATGKMQHTLEGHTAGIGQAIWSRDGKYLATGSADRTARIWDGVSAKHVKTLEGHGGAVSALAWSPDDKLATGSADKIVRIFTTGSEGVRELKGHTHPVTSVAWSRDGRTLASSAADRIIIWNPDTDKPLTTIQSDDDVLMLTIPPDGKSIFGCGSIVTRSWSLPSGKFTHKFDSGYMACTTWSADSSTLVFGVSNAVGIRNMKSDIAIASAAVYAPVYSVAWTADGKSVASGSGDRSVHLWDASNGKLRVSLVADDKQFVAISAEGHYRVAPDLESELIYVVQTEKTQDTLEPRAFFAKHAWHNNPALVKLTGN